MSTELDDICRFCGVVVTEDDHALVDGVWIDAEFDEFCESPNAELLECVECGGTGDDPDCPEYEQCSYCEGEGQVRVHQPEWLR